MKLSFVSVPVLALLALTHAACTVSSEEEVAAGSQGVTSPDTGNITIDNWTTHSRIVAIRKEVETVDAAVAKGTEPNLTTKDVCGESRTRLADAHGIRYYATESVIDDISSEIMGYYYDRKGKPRFVQHLSKSPFGIVEQMAYLDDAGKSFWEVERQLTIDDVEMDAAVPWEESGAPIELDAEIKAPGRMFDRSCAR